MSQMAAVVKAGHKKRWARQDTIPTPLPRVHEHYPCQGQTINTLVNAQLSKPPNQLQPQLSPNNSAKVSDNDSQRTTLNIPAGLMLLSPF